MEWIVRILVLGVCVFAIQVWIMGRRKIDPLGLHLAISGVLALLGWLFLLTFVSALPTHVRIWSLVFAGAAFSCLVYGLARIIR